MSITNEMPRPDFPLGHSGTAAGIHTRHVCEAGRTQGQKIAQNILDKVKFLKD